MKTLIGLGILLIVFGFVAGTAIIGTQILYVARHARHPERLTCNDLLHSDQPSLWLVLDDCKIDLFSTVRLTTPEKNVEYYAPIVGSDPELSLAMLKLSRQDANLVSKYFQPHLDDESSDASFDQMLERTARRRFEAVVTAGLDAPSPDTRRGISAALTREPAGVSRLAPNWPIIEEGRPTSAWVGFILLVPLAGVITLIPSIVTNERRQRREAKAALEHTIDAATPEGAHSVDIARIAKRVRQLEWGRFAGTGMLASIGLVILTTVPPSLPSVPTWMTILVVIATGLLILLGVRQLVIYLGLRMAWLGPLVFGLALLGAPWFPAMGWQNPTQQVTVASAMIVGGLWMKRRASLVVPGLVPHSINLAARPRHRGLGFYPSRKYFRTMYCLMLSWMAYGIGFAIAAVLEGLSKLLASVLPWHFGPNLTNILGPRVVAPFTAFGSRAARFSRRHAAPRAADVLSRDTRPPVLLLRSFDDDELRFPPSGELAHLVRSDRTFEETLVAQLWRYGPPLAIGRPGETLPMSGAVREYIERDWQGRVAELMSKARFIVIVLGITRGLAWELDAIVTAGLAHKVILVAPPVSDDSIDKRLRALSAMLQDGSAAQPFADSARVPGMICAIHRQPGTVILRAAKRDTRMFKTALDLAARTCTSSL